jgi:cell shape-determining protein MreC
MSYIDNKAYYIKMVQILELENKLLRKQIKETKQKLNELLNPSDNEGKIGIKTTNRESGSNNS